MKILKLLSPSLKNSLNRNKFYHFALKNFSGSHHNNHSAESDNTYHPRNFDRVSYNRKQSNSEREKIPFVDVLNEQETDWLKPRMTYFTPHQRTEVMIPYDTLAIDAKESLLDRTEIQARIYNLLREFDFKPLEEIDFDADYEKGLGLDSLDWTALVTSIEHEFHTVFEDSLYDHFRCINDFVEHIEKDFNCF